MSAASDEIHAQAAAWHVATMDDDACDWDAFTRWLEADPRHARAYDEIALTDAAIAARPDLFAAPNAVEHPDNVVVPFRRRIGWPTWAGGAAAAALVALVAVPQLAGPAPAIYDTQAAARTIALDDGSQIVLAPRSHIEIAGRDQDRIALDGGAWFDIRHDPARTLAITTGDETIRDIGTAFDVQTSPRALRVAVAEGHVAIESEAFDAPVRVSAGKALELDRQSHVAQVRAADSSAAGAWRQGRLSYDQASLAVVASDLARYAGTKVEVDKAVAQRRFSGTLSLGDGNAAIRDLAQVMGLAVDAAPGGYRLHAPGG